MRLFPGSERFLRPRPGPDGMGFAFPVLVVSLLAFDLLVLVGPVEASSDGLSATRSNPYAYAWLIGLLFVPYAYAIHDVGRRADVRERTLWTALLLVGLPLVLAAPFQSHDVYQYLFYAKMQVAHGANPYLVTPASLARDPWFPHVSWPRQVSAYGPLWSLGMAVCVVVSGGRLWLAVLMVKALAFLLVVLAAIGLARIVPWASGGLRARPQKSVLTFAFNPLVLTAVAIGGHADAALAAAFVWAIVWDRRGRPIVAGLLLGAAVLVKAYALFALLVYAFAVWRGRGAGLASRLVAAVAGLAFLAYAPFWGGFTTLRGVLSLGLRSSQSLAGIAQTWLSALLGWSGVVDHGSIALVVVRALGVCILVLTSVALMASPRTVSEPWRAAAILTGVFLIVTPWFLPWYVVGLVALVAPLDDKVVRTPTIVLSATGALGIVGMGSGVGAAAAYGPAMLAALRARSVRAKEQSRAQTVPPELRGQQVQSGR